MMTFSRGLRSQPRAVDLGTPFRTGKLVGVEVGGASRQIVRYREPSALGGVPLNVVGLVRELEDRLRSRGRETGRHAGLSQPDYGLEPAMAVVVRSGSERYCGEAFIGEREAVGSERTRSATKRGVGDSHCPVDSDTEMPSDDVLKVLRDQVDVDGRVDPRARRLLDDDLSVRLAAPEDVLKGHVVLSTINREADVGPLRARGVDTGSLEPPARTLRINQRAPDSPTVRAGGSRST